MALVEVKVPDIGDFEEVAVIELLVKPGDTVKAEQSLITVECDKASMEIPSSARRRGQGTEGQAGRQGQAKARVVLVLEAAGAAAAPRPAASTGCRQRRQPLRCSHRQRRRRQRRRGRRRPGRGASCPTSATSTTSR